MQRCERCKEFIETELEHEFCVFKNKPAPLRKLEVTSFPIIPEGNPPHYTRKEPKRIQRPIKHNLAPLESKPPITISTKARISYYNGFDDENYSDVARKGFEDAS